MKRPAVNHVTAEQMALLSLAELRQLLTGQLGLQRRLRDEDSAIKAELGMVTTNIHNIEARIQLVGPATRRVQVTDHAVMRYLQRVAGMDLDSLRATLDTHELREAIKHCPTGRHTIDGITYVTQKGVLVTVIYDDEARPDALPCAPSSKP